MASAWNTPIHERGRRKSGWRRPQKSTGVTATEPPAPALGSISTTITTTDLDKSSLSLEKSPRIVNCELVGSYNWLSEKLPTIVVPGKQVPKPKLRTLTKGIIQIACHMDSKIVIMALREVGGQVTSCISEAMKERLMAECQAVGLDEVEEPEEGEAVLRENTGRNEEAKSGAWARDSDSEKDFTACSASDCGYCGHCQY